MALFRTWYDNITNDSSLLRSAVYNGLRRLGYKRIKTEQLDAVGSLLSGKDVFLSVPTRFGKSLVYQLLPFCAESLLRNRTSTCHSPLVVVIAPLLSLIYYQMAKLVTKGVKAVCISGEKSSNIFADIIEGRVTRVFGSPEAFIGNNFCRVLFTMIIVESHCIV